MRVKQAIATGLTQKSPQSLIYRSRSVPEAYRHRASRLAEKTPSLRKASPTRSVSKRRTPRIHRACVSPKTA
ncbi:MAG: hypothetical protein RMY36_014825 [Nostoc sp. SerVER01]|nr:hypothetical protein [Nostoc sp. SerVER01]MDZ8023924.1 hypothetical protein [Nostoc sp. DedQUE11]MDZ8079283.1 hypothetical protein [Nostoc sp. DcaGUA01]